MWMEAVYYFMFLNLKESHWDSETAGIRGMWGALFFSWEHFITEAVSVKPLAHNLGLEAMEEEAFLQLSVPEVQASTWNSTDQASQDTDTLASLPFIAPRKYMFL